MGLGFVWKVPLIAVSSTFDLPWVGETVGNPPSTAFVPTIFSDTADISTFWDRLKNTWTYLISKYIFFSYTDEPQTEIMRKYLSPDIPNIREIERNVSLLLINSYHSFYGARPLTPALIEIGGIQVEQNDEKLNPVIFRVKTEQESANQHRVKMDGRTGLALSCSIFARKICLFRYYFEEVFVRILLTKYFCPVFNLNRSFFIKISFNESSLLK